MTLAVLYFGLNIAVTLATEFAYKLKRTLKGFTILCAFSLLFVLCTYYFPKTSTFIFVLGQIVYFYRMLNSEKRLVTVIQGKFWGIYHHLGDNDPDLIAWSEHIRGSFSEQMGSLVELQSGSGEVVNEKSSDA